MDVLNFIRQPGKDDDNTTESSTDFDSSTDRGCLYFYLYLWK